MQGNRFLAWLILLGGLLSLSSAAWAVPYASSIRNTSGSTWQFVLNEAAENVTVLRDGGNPHDFGPLVPGRYTFDMSGFSTWDVKVTQNTPVAAWTEISQCCELLTVTGQQNIWVPQNRHLHFERPDGIAINTDPSSPYFGIIYVSNERNQTTYSGRSVAAGVYSLTADLKSVNLASTNWDIPELNDTSQAKGGAFWTANPTTLNQPWRMSLDASGNLLVADWSDSYGGIKWLSPNMTNGGLVLSVEGGPTGGALNGEGEPIHGSIVSKPISTGSVGVDLTLWAMDEDLHQTLNPVPPTTHGYHVWQWNVGSETEYEGQPTLKINTSSVLPTPALPRTSDGRLNFVSVNTGAFTANAHYDPAFDKFYLTENQATGNEAGLIVVNGSGQLLWSSLQFSIDNGLDGNSGDATGGTGCSGASCAIQDIFRGMGAGLSTSPDGTKLYLHVSDIRPSIRKTNPYFGTHANSDPDLRGEVLVIPLNENGIPDIQTTGFGGTITNVQSITASVRLANLTRRELTVDAAGNIYIGNSDVEWVRVFSPGGATIATTSSNGTFNVVPIVPVPEGVLGDYNDDGTVDAADYVVWRKYENTATMLPNDPDGGTIGATQYNTWRNHFGESNPGPGAGSGAGDTAVPEPSSMLLIIFGLGAAAVRGRRGR